MPHSKISPSSSERYLNCSMSVRMQEGEPNPQSAPAALGTVIHNIAETEIKGLAVDTTLEQAWLGQKIEFADDIVIDIEQEHIDCAKTYIKFINQRHEEKGGRLFIEEQVSAHEIHEELYGTADAIIWNAETNYLEIIDLKTGKWAVDPTKNSQLMIYSLGALARHGNGDTKVCMTIVQPRTKARVKWKHYETTGEAVVQWGFHVLKPQVDKCFSDEATFKVGNWCRFCLGNHKCDEYKRYEKRRMDNVK